MKVINMDGYSDEEKKSFIPIIYSNIISQTKVICKKTIEWADAGEDGISKDSIEANFQKVVDETGDSEKLTPDLGALILSLWNDENVQKVFERRSEFQLNDSAKYYFDQVETIAATGWLPTTDDVLRSRVRTTGIVQSDFKIKGVQFSMFDVGGQRNERRKWIHCFDNVNAVIFVAALSEYDQKLYEDENTNRMTEALDLFGQICNSKWFSETSMILFLNKKDLFEEKLKKKNIDVAFEDYDGPAEYEPASKFMRNKFLGKNKNKMKSIYNHCTCATDTSNVAFVFDSVVSILLDQNMKDSGLG